MTCKGCHAKVESDGHGELIHVTPDGTPGTYGCDPSDRKAKDYPVARV